MILASNRGPYITLSFYSSMESFLDYNRESSSHICSCYLRLKCDR